VLNHCVEFQANHGVNFLLEQGCEPVLTNEFSICCQCQKSVCWNDFEEFLEQCFSFSLVAVTLFAQILPSDWNGNSSKSDADHEEIDADRTELPVGAIHGQNQFWSVDETQDELDDQFLTQVVCQESFGASGIAAWLCKTVEGCADLRQIHGSDFDQSQDESGDEIESSRVEGEVAFQDVLKGFMLHLATFLCQELVALIVMFLCG
jgi:hypothetical protein